MKQTHRQREQICACQGRGGNEEGWTGVFELVDANYYLWYGKTRGNYIQ